MCSRARASAPRWVSRAPRTWSGRSQERGVEGLPRPLLRKDPGAWGPGGRRWFGPSLATGERPLPFELSGWSLHASPSLALSGGGVGSSDPEQGLVSLEAWGSSQRKGGALVCTPATESHSTFFFALPQMCWTHGVPLTLPAFSLPVWTLPWD